MVLPDGSLCACAIVSMKILNLQCSALSVPLLEPFVIATATMTHTRAVLVRIEGEAGGKRHTGIGEAAALPPVTSEDQPDILEELNKAAPKIQGRTLVRETLEEFFGELGLRPVARAGLECALLDALSRAEGIPLHSFLGSSGEPCRLVTDITLPIGEPRHLADLAEEYASRGFGIFKIKAGKSISQDREVLEALASRVPGARIRLDANEGYRAEEALALLEYAGKLDLVVECFEQPCAREDLAGMAEVTARGGVPVVADESCRSITDLERLAERKAAHGINLKLVKLGGLGNSLRIGRRARALGLGLMAGAMVETRLGLAAMAHLVTALGGVEWLDLDTAFLLAADPFQGGYEARGSELRLLESAGAGVEA